jgi:hypothetical protein
VLKSQKTVQNYEENSTNPTGIVALLFSNILFGQEKPKEWDVSLYGFARADYIFDSRKSAYVREYNLNLYPLDVAKDTNGEDKNATGSSNFFCNL